jgi:hypothetical protein
MITLKAEPQIPFRLIYFVEVGQRQQTSKSRLVRLQMLRYFSQKTVISFVEDKEAKLANGRIKVNWREIEEKKRLRLTDRGLLAIRAVSTFRNRHKSERKDGVDGKEEKLRGLRVRR